MELLFHSTDIDERVALARELGHKEIIVCYVAPAGPSRSQQKRQSHPSTGAKEGVKTAVFVKSPNQAKALKKHFDCIIAPAKREFFENKNVDFILEPENGTRPDFIHHRNSGLNQVLLKLCQKSSKRQAKAIITTTSLLLNAKHPEVIFGRMQQNARWCKKYKVKYHVTSGARTLWEQRAASDLEAVQREIGFP